MGNISIHPVEENLQSLPSSSSTSFIGERFFKKKKKATNLIRELSGLPERIRNNQHVIGFIHPYSAQIVKSEKETNFFLQFEYSAEEDFELIIYMKAQIEENKIISKNSPSPKILCCKGIQKEFNSLKVSTPSNRIKFSMQFRLPSLWNKFTFAMNDDDIQSYDVIFVLQPLTSINNNPLLSLIQAEYYCFNFNPSFTLLSTSSLPQKKEGFSIPFQLIQHYYEVDHEIIQMTPKYSFPIFSLAPFEIKDDKEMMIMDHSLSLAAKSKPSSSSSPAASSPKKYAEDPTPPENEDQDSQNKEVDEPIPIHQAVLIKDVDNDEIIDDIAT